MHRHALTIVVVLIALAVGACARERAPGVAKDARAAPAADLSRLPELAPIRDVPGLPRVLLIGDSISIGYTLPVRRLLEGKANVHRIPFNGGSTEDGLATIEESLDGGRWDVIHFNWGLHDLKVMPDGHRQVGPAEYGRNLRVLVRRLRATGARLIWATTTPVPDHAPETDRRPGDVAAYNRIALAVMRENGVEVDDLNAEVAPRLAEMQRPRNVHFTRAGYEFLGRKVAGTIEAALPRD
jgi:acyl-CoA thioesterase-1